MNFHHKFISIIMLVVISSCSTLDVPVFLKEPVPPSDFIDLQTFNDSCPVFYDVFSIVPKIVTLLPDQSWAETDGKRFTYALVLPLGKASIQVYSPGSSDPEIGENQLLVDSRNANEYVVFSLLNKSQDRFESYTLESKSGEYTCEKGSFIFPEFIIGGGGEGYTLNARTFRRASISVQGDFFVYEQVSGDEATHKYFLFPSMKNF